jgi:hypothetical protein
MKRWLIVAAVVVLASLAIPALAAQSDRHGTSDWDVIFAQYDIRAVDAAPAGITPLEIDTPAELRRFMRQIASHGTSRLEMENASPALLAYGVTESCVSLHVYDSLVPWLKFNLWADVWVVGSGSFWEISDDVFEWVGLTGMTALESLSNEWHYHVISSDRRKVTIRGGAILDHWLYIKGLIRVYSEPVSLTMTYALR